MKPVTLCDVIDHADVSCQTVSRVADQASHVSAETRQKAEAAMVELNYIPNRTAQQLAGEQTPLIGVVAANLALHAPSQVVAVIKSRADRSSANMVIVAVERGGVESCKAAVHNLLSQYVTGLIVNYPLDEEDAIVVVVIYDTIPVLFLDVSDLTPINSMISSHDDGAHLGVEHLVQHGYQRIALLSRSHASVSARLRHADWHKYLAHYQLQPAMKLEGDWNAMSGSQQTMHMLNSGNLPTAMLVVNDQMVLGAMRTISEFGLRVVVDTSVIDYDDTEDSAYYISPLTTIRQDFPLLGETSVNRLLRLPRGGSSVGNQLLPATLVKRKTILPFDTQITTSQTLVDPLIQLTRQVFRLTPKL